MNNPVDICTLAIIIGTALVSFKGFRDQQFFDRYKFQVDSILLYREYYRLVTSSFLHGSLLHLFFNMFALYIFSSSVGSAFGPLPFLGVYFGSMIAGDLLALYIRRHNSGYSAIGASGAVSGIVFAYVTLFPQGSIGLFFFPIAIPAWLFGLLYIFGAIYGIKTKLENIGHEAHLGGAIAGIVLSILFRPYLLLENTGTILALLLPISLFLFLIIRWPEYLLIDRFFQYKARTIRENRNRRKKLEENEELDQLLEKISRRGIDSLSQRERARLETLSKRSSG
jgi:membrane associated rhomboid family serine protease